MYALLYTVVLGVPAVYLSWSSNTKVGWHPVLKVPLALLSFLFAIAYIMNHIFFKLDILYALRRCTAEQAAAAGASPTGA